MQNSLLQAVFVRQDAPPVWDLLEKSVRMEKRWLIFYWRKCCVMSNFSSLVNLQEAAYQSDKSNHLQLLSPGQAKNCMNQAVFSMRF